MGRLIPVPLGVGAYRRTYGNFPEIRLENRFVEKNPTTEEGASLLSRPGSATFTASGSAPYRGLFSKEGVFGGDLFGVSTSAGVGRLYRYELGGSPQIISGADDVLEDISFAAATGLYYEHLFIASDGTLKVYEGDSYARGYVRLTTDALGAQVILVGTIYYAWRGAGTVDAGSPDGTLANPYLLEHGSPSGATDALNEIGLQSLAKAIEASGVPGTDYSSALTTRNADVRADGDPYEFDTGAGWRWRLNLAARDRGTAGNSIDLEVSSGNIGVGNASAFGSPTTFSGGGVHALEEVTLPEGVDIARVASLNGFIVAVERDTHRFFYIYPGEKEVEALNFESAESEPDQLVDAVQAGSLVWLFGRASVEAWYASGDADRPIMPMSGLAFRIGAVEGTPAVLNNKPYFVGTDNLVYVIEGGAPRPISDTGMEERLRTSGLLEKRAWGFSLDGHFFYVLSIEDQGTFVYDETTEQWAHWYTTADSPYWDFTQGMHWRTYILGINWGRTTMRSITPTAFLDSGGALIPRVVTGVLPYRARGRARNSFVKLYAGVASTSNESLSLRFSDDGGQTWGSTFTRALTLSPSQELYFSSLGMIGAPGRVWELSDSGGIVRLDGLYVQLD